MKDILTLNAIDSIIYDHLDGYNITDESTDPTGILVRSAKMHDYEMKDSLLAIARAGAGYNNIPVADCTEKGIAVFNTPGANANGVKELVVAGMLMAGRRIVDGINWAKELTGDNVAKQVESGKSNFAGPELLGKKLGVIGLGAIGVMVANSGKSLGMKVLGYDPFISVKSAWGLSRNINRSDDIETLLKESDYVTVHVPLMDSTKNLISTEQLNIMKDTAVLLNFSRGGLVDTKAVISALADNKLGKYVTDFPDEDTVNIPGVIAIPHLGASTPESEENCASMAAKQIREFIENGNIVNSVNLPTCEMARSGKCRVTIIHKNIRNMVGQITKVLADGNHNITNMVNHSSGDVAYTVIDTDDKSDDKLRVDLENIEGVLKARII